MNEKVESILNKLLLNASLYSIEYSGIYRLSFQLVINQFIMIKLMK